MSYDFLCHTHPIGQFEDDSSAAKFGDAIEAKLRRELENAKRALAICQRRFYSDEIKFLTQQNTALRKKNERLQQQVWRLKEQLGNGNSDRLIEELRSHIEAQDRHIEYICSQVAKADG